MNALPADVVALVFAVRLRAAEQGLSALEVLEVVRAETIRDIAGDHWSDDAALDVLELLDRAEEALR